MPEQNDYQRRELDFQIDSETSENENTLKGMAIAYRSLSQDMYSFQKKTKYKERIMPCALTETISTDDVRCLFAHDSKYVLGRTKNNTLKLDEQIEGLHFSVEIPNTTWANDLATSVKRGDIDKMSFGFYPLETRWLDDEKTIAEFGTPILEIHKLRLTEISLVSNPAYKATSVRDLENEHDSNNNNEHENNNKNNMRERAIKILETKTKTTPLQVCPRGKE